MELTSLVLFYLPIIFLLAFCLKGTTNSHLSKVSNMWALLFVVAMIFAIAYFPEELNYDKPRYTNMYYKALFHYKDYDFRDPGWIVYNRACGLLFGNSIDLFYILTATLYVGATYYVGIKLFPKDNVCYLVVMAAGCLGFSNYGTNVIRAGAALSLLLLAVSLNCKIVYKIALVIIALSFQKSVIIPILAFIGAKTVKPIWLVTLIWLFCLFLSAANFDMGPLFESFGFVDERVEQYASTINDVGGGTYEKGFRWDFLLYSLAPIAIAYYYIYKIKISDSFYLSLVKTYLLANSVWLLAIRMDYSDRLAYLSWFLIPLLSLYPVIKYQNKFLRPRRVLISMMLIFMGVRIALSLRHNIL